MTQQIEARLSYSVGMKVNVGNYQSVDLHYSASEAYDVAELSTEEIDKLTETRYDILKEKLDLKLQEAVSEVGGLK
jgi:hypothetical protein